MKKIRQKGTLIKASTIIETTMVINKTIMELAAEVVVETRMIEEKRETTMETKEDTKIREIIISMNNKTKSNMAKMSKQISNSNRKNLHFSIQRREQMRRLKEKSIEQS